MKQKTFNYLIWSAFLVSLVLPFITWSQNLGWNYGSIGLYGFFPLLGLVAWMVMWTHYLSGAIRITNPGTKKPQYYSKVTGYVVLAALLLHPGLLSLAQFRAGEGLPPASYFSYLGEASEVAVMFGVIALIIFLSFEFFNRMRQKSWFSKVALWVSLSQSIAMILIFIHALRVGSDISGWFKIVWIVYGLALIPFFYIIHKSDLEQHAEATSSERETISIKKK